MEIRTFYWQDHIVSKTTMLVKRLLGKSTNSQFVYGNAGDIYAKELLERQYGVATKNINDAGNRLLCVGSIGHRASKGDILCGVGLKNEKLVPKDKDNITIYGLRGPLSFEAFKKAGFRVDTVKFLYDPGLLIKYFIPEELVNPTHVSFIPHYRERSNFRNRLPKGIQMIDIDNYPSTVAKAIKASKLVYSSSLHGIIFSHALGVPCVYVKPQTEEPEFKFIDYYESVNLTYKQPLASIHDADFKRDSDTPADVNVNEEDFFFPTAAELSEREILVK